MIITKVLPTSVHSKEKIEIQCDDCSEIYTRRYDIHVKSFNKFNKCLCPSCIDKENGKKLIGRKHSEQSIQKMREARQKRKNSEIIKICPRCGKEFSICYALRNQIYCGKSCAIRSRLEVDNRKTLICPICQKKFRFHGERKFCSKKCSAKHFSETRIGENNPAYGTKRTEENIRKAVQGKKNMVITDEYRKKLSESLKGEKNHNWNPDREEVKNRIILSDACRRLLRRLAKDRPKHWKPEDELGYSYEEFRKRIESTWKSWMNWKNNGKQYKPGEERKWQIDHIKPIAEFHKEGINDPKIINALSNLQALDANENNRKNNRYINPSNCQKPVLNNIPI